MPDTTYMCLLLRQVFLLYLLVLCHQHHFQWQLWDDDLQRKEFVWEQEQQCMSRMKLKAPASCASRAQHLRPVKISQKGGKGVGTNTDHSILPACATNHGVDFLLQDTADLWRGTVWVRLPFSRTEHSCCLDVRGQLITVFGSQLGILTFWKTVCF